MDLLSIYYHPTPATQLRFQDYDNISNILALHLQMITDLVDFFPELKSKSCTAGQISQN